MVRPCACVEVHNPRWIVLTGGPGAGKTAFLELVRHSFCAHVRVLPEAAGLLFGGGFPREDAAEARRAAQRAIFHVQRELEAVAGTHDSAIVLCDRGTVDGVAYWPGPSDFWSSVGTTAEAELERYDAVIHLRTPTRAGGYNNENPLRIESPASAAEIDDRILAAWQSHPRRWVVESSPEFLSKAERTIEILRSEMPECCAGHLLMGTAASDSRS